MALTGWIRVLAGLLVSVAWMVVSSFLILLNRYIMVEIHFPYPITVATLGMVGSSILAFVCCHVLRIAKADTSLTMYFWLTRILPVGLCMALTLWTGNAVYFYLTVSLIQMLKAFSPVLTMAALFIARLEDPTKRIIASVLVTTAGRHF
ncbi:hypothetical protein FOA52_013072 [Chlamydomonas sp. UWO 241]|nr:hypothetical protein FOA52_013072 [Chlamydomonas sp. UWO 241]